MINFRA